MPQRQDYLFAGIEFKLQVTQILAGRITRRLSVETGESRACASLPIAADLSGFGLVAALTEKLEKNSHKTNKGINCIGPTTHVGQ